MEKSEVSHEKSQTFPEIKGNFQLSKAKDKSEPVYNPDNTSKTNNAFYKILGKGPEASEARECSQAVSNYSVSGGATL